MGALAAFPEIRKPHVLHQRVHFLLLLTELPIQALSVTWDGMPQVALWLEARAADLLLFRAQDMPFILSLRDLLQVLILGVAEEAGPEILPGLLQVLAVVLVPGPCTL